MQRINLVVLSPERERVEFSLSDRMPLYKMMKAYADYFVIDRKQLSFRFRGNNIKDYETAHHLNIRKGNIIRCVTDSTN